MLDQFDRRIRKALGDIIRAAVPDAIVWDYQALGYNPVNWLGLVRDKTTNRAHGYIVTRQRIFQTGDNSVDEEWAYTILGLYSYFHNGPDEAERSEDLFGDEVDLLCLEFRPNRIVELEPGEPTTAESVRFADLNATMDIFAFGPEYAHQVIFELVVTFSIC